MKDRFKLNKEKREDMIKSIKYYFSEERDEDLGDLAAGFILDFFIEELAPEFYNIGVADSYKFLSEKLEDIYSIQIYK